MKKYDKVRDEMLKNPKVKKEYDKLEKEYTEEQDKITKYMDKNFLEFFIDFHNKKMVDRILRVAVFKQYLYNIIDNIFIEEATDNSLRIKELIPMKTCMKIYKKSKKNIKKKDTFNIINDYDAIIISLGLLHRLSQIGLIDSSVYTRIYKKEYIDYRYRYGKILNKDRIIDVSMALNLLIYAIARNAKRDRDLYYSNFNIKPYASAWDAIVEYYEKPWDNKQTKGE